MANKAGGRESAAISLRSKKPGHTFILPFNLAEREIAQQ